MKPYTVRNKLKFSLVHMAIPPSLNVVFLSKNKYIFSHVKISMPPYLNSAVLNIYKFKF